MVDYLGSVDDFSMYVEHEDFASEILVRDMQDLHKVIVQKPLVSVCWLAGFNQVAFFMIPFALCAMTARTPLLDIR